MRRRLCALVATGLVALLCGTGCDDESEDARTAPVAAPPEASDSFFGIVAEDVLAGDADYRRRTLARMRSTGVTLIRQTFHWDRIERAPGEFDFAEYDAYVRDVTRAGIEILPILFTPPEFRAPRGPERGTYPPDRAVDMAAFAEVLVRRYGPGGEFWRANPDLRERPITAWQVWNEPNLPVYWPEGPDPAAYVELLRTVHDRIKAVDAEARVVSAGLSESTQGMPFQEFVGGMFDAGAGDALEVFALHAFAQGTAGSIAAVQSTRVLLDELGSSGTPIWITEVGWASGGPASPFTVGEEGQAIRVRETLTALSRRRDELGLRGVIYYSWRDAPIYEGGGDFFGLHTGLLDIDGRPKPALEAYGAAARG